MILASDRPVQERVIAGLEQFETEVAPLPALSVASVRDAFIEQLVESRRRKRYLERLTVVPLDAVSGDASSPLFDPYRASVLASRAGKPAEALWLLFLATYFGHNRKGGWRHVREVYGRLGHSDSWTWDRTVQEFAEFQGWALAHISDFKSRTTPGGFGNHRKYESYKRLPNAVGTYIAWAQASLLAPGSVLTDSTLTPGERFDALYRSMGSVAQFGRVARFDYLSTAWRLGHLDVRPPRMYLSGSTGPITGAKLLVGPDRRCTPLQLDEYLSRLDDYIDVGLDSLEDAICNWQKSPQKFKSFRG